MFIHSLHLYLIWSALLRHILSFFLWASVSILFSLGGPDASSLGVHLLPLLLWISGLSPPQLSLSQLPEFPPLPATSLWLGPLFLSLCPPCLLRVTPAPCRAGSLSAVPPASLSWAGWGIPPGSWKKQLGPRERPSVSPGARPLPRAWGSLPESAGPRQEALRFLASPRRPPDLAPTPPANSPNIIPQEESVAAGGGPG